MHYDIEDKDLRGKSRDNSGTGVELLQPSLELKSYKSVRKQLLFLMMNDTCMKKEIQKIMK